MGGFFSQAGFFVDIAGNFEYEACTLEILMKSNIHKILALLVVAGVSSFASNQSQAADLALEGTGSYTLASTFKYSASRKQSGRYTNLGAYYYQSTKLQMDKVTNYSNYTSRSMSFEFWGTEYYGATSGTVLMTASLNRLKKYKSLNKINRSGFAIYLNGSANYYGYESTLYYPQFNLYENTGGSNWTWRDELLFSYSDYL